MVTPLCILIIGHYSENDAGLIVRHLEQDGYPVKDEWVETAEGMNAALEKQGWDMIIHTGNLSGFSVSDALAMLQKVGLEIPFVVFPATTCEGTTIDLMKTRLEQILSFTDRKTTQETRLELPENLDWSEFIYNGTTDAIFLLAVEPNDMYRVLTVNTAYRNATGISEARVVGKQTHEFFKEQDMDDQYYHGQYKKAIQLGHPIQFEETINLPRGTSIVETTLTPIFDQTGRCTYLLGSTRDITQRKKMEASLQESEEKFRQIVERANDVFYRQNIPSTFFEYVSPKIYDLSGYTPEEFLRMDLEDQKAHVHPNDLPDLIHFVKDLIEADDKGKKFIEREFRIKTRQGDYRWVHGNYTLIRDKDNQPQYVVGSLTDISERKKVEEALRDKVEELDRYFTSSLDLLCIADTDGHFIRLNPEWEKVLGYTTTELEGKIFLDYVHPQDIESTQAAILKLVKGEPILNFENRFRHQNGSYKWIEWRSKSLGTQIYAVARDITDRKQAETQIHEQLKELRRWHAVTLGREERILELKEEVNRLLVQAGQQPRYKVPQKMGIAHG